MSRSKAARYLVELGAPTGVYDHNGEMALSLLILKMPEVAIIALDQFRSEDMINRKEYYFINYVEGPRIFDKDPRENRARSPLEVAVQHEHYGIVMHPVMRRLINIKWEKFGKRGARNDLITNVIFAFVWTILGITMPMYADNLYSPMEKCWWRLLIALAGIFLTGLEVFKQVLSLIYMNRAIWRWKLFRENALKNDKRFCHPQWRDENEYLDKEIKIAREERLFSRQDSWIYMDWMALLLIVAGLTSHIVFLVVGSTFSRDVHLRIVAFLLVTLWIRLLKFARPFKDPGPFVASMSPMLKDFIKWSLLFCLLFIPYAAIFWMIFGPVNSQPASTFSDIPGLLFSVFTMAVFSALEPVHELAEIDPTMARLLVSSFVGVSTIITLNLLIAMLADTFTRKYENSLETATMQRAKTILYLEQALTSTKWQKYCEYIRGECSPEVTSLRENMSMGKRDKLRQKENLYLSVNEIHALVSDRFAQRVGKQKSDMDRLLEGVNKTNENISTVLCQLEGDNGTEFLDNSSVLNLTIVLEQPKRRTKGAKTMSMAIKTGPRRTRKVRSDHKQSFNTSKNKSGKSEKNKLEPKRKIDARLRTSSMSSDLSSYASEAGTVNDKIVRQLQNVLDLMKHALQKGKLNVKPGQVGLDEELNNGGVTGDQLQSVEETGTWTGDDGVFTRASEKDWAHYETQIEGNDEFHVTGDPGWYQRTNIGIRDGENTGNVNDVSQQISLDTYDGVPQRNDSRSQSSATEDHSSPQRDTFKTERLRVRSDGSSFLSSSSEGNTTWDDTVHDGSKSSGRSSYLNFNASRRKETNKESQNNNFKEQYPDDFIHAQRYLSVSENSDSNCSTPHTDNSSMQVSDDVSSHQLSDVTEYPYSGDDISSNKASDTSSQYFSDNALSAQASDVISLESVVTSPTGPSEVTAKFPRVRWADTVKDSSGTPFLNIREISASSSDNYSSDNHSGRDSASSEEGLSREGSQIRVKTD